MEITEWDANKIIIWLTEANIAAMDKACFLVEATVKKSMPKQGEGRTVQGKWIAGAYYPRHGKKHYASAPGLPPARDTGKLIQSIHSETLRDGDSIRGYVGSYLDHALWLETGTSKMKPRPYLRPALQKTRLQVEQIFDKANK